MRIQNLLHAALLPLLAAGQQVIEPALDPETPVTVKVSDRNPSTLLFPDAITAIIGSDLTDGNDGNDSAAFQYKHPPGSKMVALIARRKSESAPMVVYTDSQLFVVNLRYSETSNLAVTFKQKEPATSTPPATLGPPKPVLPPLDFSPPKLMRLMELAQSHRLPTSNIPSRPCNYQTILGNLTATVDHVTRFDHDDAIVVSGRIKNSSFLKKEQLRPSRFALKIGRRFFPVSMAVAPTSVPRRGTVHFTAIVMGDGYRRAGVALSNSFYLALTPTR